MTPMLLSEQFFNPCPFGSHIIKEMLMTILQLLHSQSSFLGKATVRENESWRHAMRTLLKVWLNCLEVSDWVRETREWGKVDYRIMRQIYINLPSFLCSITGRHAHSFFFTLEEQFSQPSFITYHRQVGRFNWIDWSTFFLVGYFNRLYHICYFIT